MSVNEMIEMVEPAGNNDLHHIIGYERRDMV